MVSDTKSCASDLSDTPKINGSSLSAIIQGNDIAKLHQYITTFGCPVHSSLRALREDDALFLAAAEALPETLCVLLKAYATASEPRQTSDQPGCSLLHAACCGANLDVVRFILDSNDSQENRLPLGVVDLQERSYYRETPILVAASLLPGLSFDADQVEVESADRERWIRDRIVKIEELMNFLLDRGASATDVIPSSPNATGADRQPHESVLGLAVSRAGKKLIQRLIDCGAKVYLKQQHYHYWALLGFKDGKETHSVTPLHIASQFWNVDIVALLLGYRDHRTSNSDADRLSPRDSYGRIPLHWAAGGYGNVECKLPDDMLTAKITETFRLLFEHNPSGINLRDHSGSTPLHYAAAAHATCGGSNHATAAVQCLLEYGAVPSIPDDVGQTVLHILGYRSAGSPPISSSLVNLLVTHGVDVNHADKTGKTALRILARNLCQVSVVNSLLDHGADVRTADSKGDTPFHAAARGMLNPHEDRDGKIQVPTLEDRIRSQDEMLRVLQKAAGVDSTMIMMNQRNLEGKTPLQILQETRDRWRGWEHTARGGMGRGRGRGRVKEGGC